MTATIIRILAVLSLACGFTLEPVTPWEPDPAEAAYISRTIWGEARGCCREEQEAVGWCILNRVDDERFPNTVEGVVTAPFQWQGYGPDNPEEDFHGMAADILRRWHDGEKGIPVDMCWCEGDGVHQVFRNSWERTEATRYWP